MREITKKEIDNYMLFMNELSANIESETKFSMRYLYSKHKVNRKASGVMKELGYIDFIGHGANIKYTFKLFKIQPIHARNLIENIIERENLHYSKTKSNSNSKSNVSYNLPDYIKFMKLLKFNIDNGFDFKIADMIKQCNVDNLIITHMKSSNLIDIDSSGIKFKIDKIEPENVRLVISNIQKYKSDQNKLSTIISRGYIKSESENDFIVSFLDPLMDAKKDTNEYQKLVKLTELVSKFEKAKYTFPEPKVENIIQHNVEQRGMNTNKAIDEALKETFPIVYDASKKESTLIKTISETKRIGLFKKITTTTYFYDSI